MKFINTLKYRLSKRKFVQKGIQILKDHGELLVLIRHPYAGGNKDHIIISSAEALKILIDSRTAKDSITLFKTIERVADGIITEDFITQTLAQLQRPKYSEWLLLFPHLKDKYSLTCWDYSENTKELEESLRHDIGNYVSIIEYHDFTDDDLVFHMYIPDEDGKVRPGAY